MQKSIVLIIILAAAFSCSNEKNSIIGTWKGKNYAGEDILWVFNPDGSAGTSRGAAIQQMIFTTDETKSPHHLNVNSLVDTNTLRAIYKFTESGKLIIGINKDPVTIRPADFNTPNLQRLSLTKKK
jgi:hypothetical protein